MKIEYKTFLIWNWKGYNCSKYPFLLYKISFLKATQLSSWCLFKNTINFYVILFHHVTWGSTNQNMINEPISVNHSNNCLINTDQNNLIGSSSSRRCEIGSSNIFFHKQAAWIIIYNVHWIWYVQIGFWYF